MSAPFIQNAYSGTVDANAVALTSTYLLSDGLMFGNIFQRYQKFDKTPFLDFLEMEKAWTPIPRGFDQNRLVRWHELGALQQNAQIASFIGGATLGATATITVAAASHFGTNGLSSPFEQGSIIAVNGKGMIITTKTPIANATTLLVTPPTGATYTLASVLAPNAIMVPMGYYAADKSGYQISNQRMPFVYTAPIAIMKKKKEIGGSEAVNAQKVAFPGAGGKPFLVYQMDIDNIAECKKEFNNGLLFGNGDSYVDAGGNLIQEMAGAITQVKARGNDYPYQGSLTLSDAYDWTRIIIKNGGPEKYFLKRGFEVNIQLEQLFDEKLRNGGRIYLERGDNMHFVDYGIDAVEVNKKYFLSQPEDDFNNPIVGNAPGMNHAYSALIMPMKDVEDPMMNTTNMSMSIAYPEQVAISGGTLNRRWEINKGGENGVNKDSENDVLNFRCKVEGGFVGRGLNESIFVRKSDLV